MVASILRRLVRGLPVSIPVIGMVAVIIVMWLQNHATVRRDGDFFVLTPDEVCERFPSRTPDGDDAVSDEGIADESPQQANSRQSASVPVARKYVMTRRAGFQAFGRGHSIVHEAEIPEFNGQAPFLKRLNEHLRTQSLQTSREFTEVEWSTVIDGFRDPSFSMLNWDGETKIDIVFVSETAVSFAEYRHEYTGGAHGNHWVSGRNFISDPKGLRELALSDLFDQEQDWLRMLLRVCLTELHRQGASRVGEACLEDPIESGFTAEDLQSFTLSSEGLRFYFSPYHMGCYAEGLYSVHVPYSAMIVFIPAGSPLRLFMNGTVSQTAGT